MTVRLITLLKRREGMSKADFTAYYEGHHRLIGEKVLSGYASRYVRRHLHSMEGDEQEVDVILEIEFPDQRTMNACFAAMAEPSVMAEIVADEERLFDRDRIRSFSETAYESDLRPPRG